MFLWFPDEHLQFMRFSAAEVLPLCQEHSHDSFFNDDWRQMTKRGNFNQRKSWHVIRKRNQHSFWSIVPGEVLKNSHVLFYFIFFFTQRLCKKLLKYCLIWSTGQLKVLLLSSGNWKPNGIGKLTCPVKTKLDVTKLNVVVKLGCWLK